LDEYYSFDRFLTKFIVLDKLDRNTTNQINDSGSKEKKSRWSTKLTTNSGRRENSIISKDCGVAAANLSYSFFKENKIINKSADPRVNFPNFCRCVLMYDSL
jgi:hypothetical protein